MYVRTNLLNVQTYSNIYIFIDAKQEYEKGKGVNLGPAQSSSSNVCLVVGWLLCTILHREHKLVTLTEARAEVVGKIGDTRVTLVTMNMTAETLVVQQWH